MVEPQQVSIGAFALLEERVRRRRIDRCLSNARQAMAERRLSEAAAALDEVRELDPHEPALTELAVELTALQSDSPQNFDRMTAVDRAEMEDRILDLSIADPAFDPVLVSDRASQGGHRGAWVAAAAILIGAAAFAAWPRPQSLRARPTAGSVPVGALSLPGPATEVLADRPVTNPAGPALTEDRTVPISPRVSPPLVVPDRPAADPPAAPPVDVAAEPAATPFPPVDDPAGVRDTLQRYRRAYNGLDAQLTHAVFPVLDEGALAHAFSSVRSQSLDFETCSIDVRGESARAVCRGSARSVPMVGSQTPRTERRVWTFMLSKTDGDWKIADARTDR